MGNESIAPVQSFREKLLFYTTAFFILLGTFSLFAFLFLVPFVIDPAFTTIFMEFDETPALCETMGAEVRGGASNCNWTSCREGCTKELYNCTQILVKYKRGAGVGMPAFIPYELVTEPPPVKRKMMVWKKQHKKRAIRSDYDYEDPRSVSSYSGIEYSNVDADDDASDTSDTPVFGLQANDSEWYYTGARLFPNVKGCGYPPTLNCTIFKNRYQEIGTNFSCYYSQVDPGLVISYLDMWQVYMNLVYAMAIPIPSFIISVIYLTFAYFKIYNEDEETVLLEENAEGMDVDGTQIVITPVPDAATPIVPESEALTPASEAFREDLASFGHQFKVAMVDELSRESFAVPISNSISIPGNLTKTMTTSISTPAGAISDL